VLKRRNVDERLNDRHVDTWRVQICFTTLKPSTGFLVETIDAQRLSIPQLLVYIDLVMSFVMFLSRRRG